MSIFRVGLVFPLVAAVCVLASWGHAQTFSNSSPITIPAPGIAGGSSSPYPSAINVTGGPTSIGYVSVTLSGFSHTFVEDVSVVLVSPTGQTILLMSRTHGSGDASNASLTFIPDGTTILPTGTSGVVSGVYGCSVFGSQPTLPTPAPTGPYATSLAPLIGTNANGTWNLYVFDTFPEADNGSFSGGWSISFSSTAPGPASTAFTYQGVLTSNGTPINGDANVRFTICTNPTIPTAFSTIGSPITRAFTGVSGGQITTTLDFGSAFDTNQARWLNIEVESPPGSGFVTLLPRQPITTTPQARVAQFATSAVSAVNASNASNAINATNAVNATNATNAAFAANAASVPWTGITGVPANVSGAFSPWIAGAAGITYDAGFVGIGDLAPAQRLTVGGSIQLNTAAPPAAANRLAFGTIGVLASGADNTDPMYFERFNAGPNLSELRLIIGDDAAVATADSFRIIRFGVPALTELFRFQSDGNAFKVGGGSWAGLSDPRAKHDIAPLSGTLERLLQLRGYSFVYNDDRIARGLAGPGPQVGLMADEVARVFPDWVSTDADGTLYVTERATTALMVEALRDLRAEKDAAAAAAQAQIDALRDELASRDAETAELKARLEAIEAAMLRLKRD